MLHRRNFLKNVSLSASTLAFAAGGGMILPTPTKAELAIPYEKTVRDHLWMWGHGEGTTNGLYNIPEGGKLHPADAVREMGIPNVCMIRWRGRPEPEIYETYNQKFAGVKRFAWSIIDGAPQPYDVKKRDAFEIAKKFPNLTTLFLDDFFIGNPAPRPGSEESPAHLSLAQIQQLHEETQNFERPLDLAMVLYSNQLTSPAISRHIAHCDVVSLWTWNAKDLANLEQNFARFRELVPEKRTMLGIYMWDFGDARPVPSELMKHQCEYALQLLKKGEIEGMIFHCTPLVDMNIEAVQWSKDWIAEVGETVI